MQCAQIETLFLAVCNTINWVFYLRNALSDLIRFATVLHWRRFVWSPLLYNVSLGSCGFSWLTYEIQSKVFCKRERSPMVEKNTIRRE